VIYLSGLIGDEQNVSRRNLLHHVAGEKKPAPALEASLSALEGISKPTVNSTTGKLWVEYDQQRANLPKMAEKNTPRSMDMTAECLLYYRFSCAYILLML
jgi:hypothetical protein